MTVCFTQSAWNDYLYFQQIDKKLVVKINLLIKDITRTPFNGIGKPEPLKHGSSGLWSRRIDLEHRLVYQVSDDKAIIHQCRYHY
jgi:toxin YoeB